MLTYVTVYCDQCCFMDYFLMFHSYDDPYQNYSLVIRSFDVYLRKFLCLFAEVSMVLEKPNWVSYKDDLEYYIFIVEKL